MMSDIPEAKGGIMSLVAESEYDGLPSAETSAASRMPSRPSMAIVTLVCAAAVGFALVGAAYAVDGPRGLGNATTKGDRVADVVPAAPGITIEDANIDAGFSNLIRIEPTNPVEFVR